MTTQRVEHKLMLLPDKPGCYLMKDINGQIIYVGKAKNLKNRVRSYFKSSHTGKVAAMVDQVADFDIITTDSNKESFLLEITLIQKHQPYYNIKLKRGTGYPYIKITNERDYRSDKKRWCLLFWPLSKRLRSGRNAALYSKGLSAAPLPRTSRTALSLLSHGAVPGSMF